MCETETGTLEWPTKSIDVLSGLAAVEIVLGTQLRYEMGKDAVDMALSTSLFYLLLLLLPCCCATTTLFTLTTDHSAQQRRAAERRHYGLIAKQVFFGCAKLLRAEALRQQSC